MKQKTRPLSRLARRPSQQGFTLIELLVVIGIIAILASLSFAGVQAALDAAKRTQAGNMVTNMKIAWTGYFTEYGSWPNDAAEGTAYDQKAAYRILANKETTNPKFNSRGIVFMEFAKKDLDNQNSPTQAVDPWSSPTKLQLYLLFFDTDYDNKITIPANAGVTGLPAQPLDVSVAVYSKGKPKDTAYPKPIFSW